MNDDTNITLKAAPATADDCSESVACRVKRLACELAELLVDDQGGQLFLRIYPAGHEKGVALHAIESPSLVIPLVEYRGTPYPGLHGYKAVAMAMRELEDDVNYLSRSAQVLDDYISLVFDRVERRIDGQRSYELDEITKDNLWFLSLDVNRRASQLLEAYNLASAYPIEKRGVP